VSRLSPSFLASLGHAFDGWNKVLATQRNMRIHVGVALGLCALCTPLSLYAEETALLLTLVGLVFAAELMNSAFEACVDLCSPLPHPLAKLAKDAAAAAVLVLALTAVAAFFVLFARQWPFLQNEWRQCGPAWVLLGCSWLVACAEWAWLRHHRVASPFFRLVATLLWLGGWPYALNLPFWGLGAFLLGLSGFQQKTKNRQNYEEEKGGVWEGEAS